MAFEEKIHQVEEVKRRKPNVKSEHARNQGIAMETAPFTV
jgi:hypothetical protein